ncbi:MAG: DUF692 family multinuclear iron-containing protein [Rufibacter sp.]
MPGVLSAIACNLDVDILSAAFPLLEEERVQALEWSFDALFQTKDIPSWFTDLINTFSQEKRLLGHGVFFSLFSGKWSEGQKSWLQQLRQLSRHYQFDHITEHFGFMTGKNFHHGAPLNVPFTSTTLAIGQDRLAHIQDACQCPVGLENLAFAYSVEEVKKHGEFLEKLVEPVNGFLILDLHNLYCQLHNFSVPFEEIIQLYPLGRVREIHISGGSWENSSVTPSRKIRRDTHDAQVPEDVFELLQRALPLCPNLKYVVLEQLGNGLKTAESKYLFYQDYLQLEKLVQQHNQTSGLSQDRALHFMPNAPVPLSRLVEDETLYREQIQLSQILEEATSYEEARNLLSTSSLAHSDWKLETWEPAMLETSIHLAQKWKKK